MARVGLFSDFQQGFAEFRVFGETLDAGIKPAIDLRIGRAQVRLQCGRIAFRVIDEKSGIDTEEFRQQVARRLRQVRPRTAFAEAP